MSDGRGQPRKNLGDHGGLVGRETASPSSGSPDPEPARRIGVRVNNFDRAADRRGYDRYDEGYYDGMCEAYEMALEWANEHMSDHEYPCCVHRWNSEAQHTHRNPCPITGCPGSVPVGPTKEGKQ